MVVRRAGGLDGKREAQLRCAYTRDTLGVCTPRESAYVIGCQLISRQEWTTTLDAPQVTNSSRQN